MPALILSKQQKISIPIPSVWGMAAFCLFMAIIIGGRYAQFGSIVIRGVIPLFFIFIVLNFRNPVKWLPAEFYTYIGLFIWSLLSIIVVEEIYWYIRYNRVMLGIILVYFIINQLVFYKKAFEYINWALILSTIFIFLEIFINLGISLDHFYLLQATGSLFYTDASIDGANEIGGQVLVSLLSVLFLLCIYKKKWPRLLLDILAVIMLIFAILSGSRGAFVPAIFAYFFYMGFIRFKINIFTYLFVFLLIGVASFYMFEYVSENTFIGYKLNNLGNSEGDQTRAHALYEGLNMMWSSPIIGVGAGNFIAHFSVRLYSHNDFIEIISTLGIVGFAIYYFYYYQLIRKIKYLKKRIKKSSENYKLMKLFLLSIFVCLAHGMSKPLFVDMGFMTMFALISAYSNKLYYSYSNHKY
jgi:O-antigen ligase